ncbi:MAG: type II toxin-antitoxin system HicB family antitoxin [Defluviitaleaceae bacterium]|nr:type II toxin-antitoxin system HicB family antitoxin [Defluviitaleaceae bacterium]
MQKYSVSICFSKSDNCYVASIPELKGCMAHGDTYIEAIKEIQDAMDLHIEMILELGHELPQPKLLA